MKPNCEWASHWPSLVLLCLSVRQLLVWACLFRLNVSMPKWPLLVCCGRVNHEFVLNVTLMEEYVFSCCTCRWLQESTNVSIMGMSAGERGDVSASGVLKLSRERERERKLNNLPGTPLHPGGPARKMEMGADVCEFTEEVSLHWVISKRHTWIGSWRTGLGLFFSPSLPPSLFFFSLSPRRLFCLKVSTDCGCHHPDPRGAGVPPTPAAYPSLKSPWIPSAFPWIMFDFISQPVSFPHTLCPPLVLISHVLLGLLVLFWKQNEADEECCVHIVRHVCTDTVAWMYTLHLTKLQSCTVCAKVHLRGEKTLTIWL